MTQWKEVKETKSSIGGMSTEDYSKYKFIGNIPHEYYGRYSDIYLTVFDEYDPILEFNYALMGMDLFQYHTNPENLIGFEHREHILDNLITPIGNEDHAGEISDNAASVIFHETKSPELDMLCNLHIEDWYMSDVSPYVDEKEDGSINIIIYLSEHKL